MQRLSSLSVRLSSDPLHYLGLSGLIPTEHKAILSKIEAFCQLNLHTEQFMDCYDKAQFPDYLLPQLQSLQIGQYFIPAPFGKELPLLMQGLIISTFAAHDLGFSTFLFLQLPLSARTIFQLGSQEQKERYLPQMIGLRKICGWALTEREVGSNSTRLGTTFKREGGELVLNGNKRWIGNGNRDLLIVYGNLQGEKRVVGAVVEVGSEGLRSEKIENKYSFRMVQNCQIEFKDVRINEKQLMPKAVNYKIGVEKTLQHSRIIVIWNTVGAGIGVFRAAVRALRAVPSSHKSYGLLREKGMRLMGEVQAMLLCAWRLTELAEKGGLQTATVGMFKAWVTGRGRSVCILGKEIVGASGDVGVHKALLDMEVLYTYEGTYDINTLLAGSQLTGLKAFT